MNHAMAFLEYRPITPLHHYTSTEAFEGIIKSGNLWFNDLRASNDPREIIFPTEELMSAIKKFDVESIPPEEREIKMQISLNLFQQLKTLKVFSVSLTPNSDDRVFWQEYGNQGSGLSIAFRPRSLIDMPVRIQKVNYIDENENDVFEKVYKLQLEKIAGYDVESFPLTNEIDIVVELISEIYSTKHSSWSDEREVRLTFAFGPFDPKDEPIEIAQLPNGESILNKPPLERDTGNKILQYREFQYGKFNNGKYNKSGAISDVIVGCNCRLSIAEVDEILVENGFTNFSVAKSKCVF